jgi:polyhydroxyalkanoate synthase
MQEEMGEKMQACLEGIEACHGQNFTHEPSDHAVIWQRGNAQLLDYAPDATNAVAVLCIPSLINKSTILDLLPEASFMQHLKSQNMRPVILDWGSPDGADSEALDYNCADYLQAIAMQALAHLREHHDGPIVLLGYCMGGVFALGLAQLSPIATDGLILLATPWDFASDDTPVILLNPASHASLSQYFSQTNPVPASLVQMIFYWINPTASFEKFIEFTSLNEDEKRHFAAIEHWVQDGVPLANQVAQECLIDWPQQNQLKNHRFAIGRKWLEPKAISCDTLLIAAKRDKIVPINCAKPLAKELNRCQIITPDSGHVGMIAGARAPQLCWQPITNWLDERFG